VELLACRNYDSVTPDIERLEKAVAQVQLDKVLNHKLGSHTLKEIIELWQCYTERLELITKLTQLYDEGKLVKESEDQSLPEGVGRCMDCTDSYKMQEAGFKKVEPL